MQKYHIIIEKTMVKFFALSRKIAINLEFLS